MLKHLRITNFAILSDVSLELGPGFNVLTGETGAGKSLIVDAVALLRGARASADIPRAGADEGLVDPSRHQSILDAFGVEPKLIAEAEAAYARVRAAAEALAGASGDERSRAQREDFLRFQIEELDGAKLKAGEETELASERERL